MNYLNFINTDLISIILKYLDISIIENINNLNIINNYNKILDSKKFWMDKLEIDGLSDYIPFITNNFNDNNLDSRYKYIQNYNIFIGVDENIFNFIQGFIRIRSILQFGMKKDIDMRDLIKINDLEILKELVDMTNPINTVQIEYKNKHFLCTRVSHNMTLEIINKNEFKKLLIILELIGYNVFALSNLEEQYEALEELF